MPEMATLTLNGVTYEVVDQAARDYMKRLAATRNILDNSYFKRAINQRGNDSYELSSYGGYCIDRWAAHNGGATVSVSYTDGLTLAGTIYQPISSHTTEQYNGKTLTLAAKIEGVIYCCSGVVTQKAEWNRSAILDTATGAIAFETEEDDTMRVIITNNTSAVVEWIALYEGEYTLETLPDYYAKGYDAELAVCQGYYRTLSGVFVATKSNDIFGTYITFNIPTSASMNISMPNILGDPRIGTIFSIGGETITDCTLVKVISFDDKFTVLLGTAAEIPDTPMIVSDFYVCLSEDL